MQDPVTEIFPYPTSVDDAISFKYRDKYPITYICYFQTMKHVQIFYRPSKLGCFVQFRTHNQHNLYAIIFVPQKKVHI